jgi:HAD superfamily hydrolase (TIGR01509 family)
MNEIEGLEWGKVKAILFDIDGTLSESDDQMVANLEKLLKIPFFMLNGPSRHKFARWLVMAMESPGNFLYNLADRISLDSFLIKLLNRQTRAKKHKIKKYWIVSGVKEMLEKLNGKLLMGVVSARDEGSSLAFIHQFGLERHFRIVVTSQTCLHTKPFPDPLLYAAEKLKVKPENCLMVGDTTVDIRAARLAGMQSVGVLCGFGTRRELVRAGADLILNSPAEILELIESHIKAAI